MVGLRALAVFMGVFVFSMGIDKGEWLTNSGILASRLQEWHATAPPISRWYLEHLALPGAAVFARLVVVGELAVGTALVSGFHVRWAAAVMLVMVLNFHFASDLIFHSSYLTNPYGLPVLGGLLALTLNGKRLPFSVSR